MKKKWTLKPFDPNHSRRLQSELNIHPVLCQLLAGRGIADYAAAKAFFRPQLKCLHDPYLMKDMTLAVDRIEQAVQRREKVMVYGDYDVDGTTAVALLYSFLKENFPDLPLCYYIPNRYSEGYGVSRQGIECADRSDCKLIITLDCGIKSAEKTKLAKDLGIDLIICDHHLPGSVLPEAYAILNPKQPGCSYPFKELSGCGIGFKLTCALAKRLHIPEVAAMRHLDLVATSIAADIVPIEGENRILAFYGIKRANEYPCQALQTIKNIMQIKRDLTIEDMVFIIAPRINAAGRMGDARKAVAFFLEEDAQRSLEQATELQRENFNRKEIDKEMTREALQLLAEDTGREYRSTVLYQPHWHKGVVGIVASRVLERYYRPTIVLTQSNGMITGSARSITGVNIYQAIHNCRELLENYGGHYFAAGLSLLPENLTAFRNKFEATVNEMIDETSMIPEICIDADLPINEITPAFFRILRQFEPFGPANLKPVFRSRRVCDYRNCSRIVKDQHIRFVVTQDNKTCISGIGFGLADKFTYIASGEPFDILYTLEENEWQDRKHLQIKVIDIAAAT